MEFFVVIAIIWGIFAFISSLKKKSPPTNPTPYRRPSDSSTVQTKPNPNVYRPTQVKRRPVIQFISNDSNTGPLTDIDIKDLVDALTGAPLQLNAGLFQCKRCKVFYQEQSVEVIRAENGGRCVSCLHPELVSVTGRREQRGRNAEVDVITLKNYQDHVGHVITFEGYVHKVLTSRRGTDYAVMFENSSWTKGFKMVAFRGSAERIGGKQFLNSLNNRTIRVRGLLTHHQTFGFQILISEKAMILSIQ